MVATPRQAYRRPRRRPAHLRTKTGCLTCRRRKKKCDETHSRCMNCIKQRIECVWPSECIEHNNSLPKSAGLLNPAHGARGQGHSESTPVSLAMLLCTPEQEQMLVPIQDGNKPAQMEDESSCQNDLPMAHCAKNPAGIESIVCAPVTYSPAITPESGNLFDFLRRRFLPELIRPAAKSEVIDALSRETMLLALDKPFCMHALLACCGAEIPTQDQKPRQLARLHYTQAVKALRKNLNESNIQSQWIVTTLTVMMLCIYERSKAHGSSGVEIHLSGAARMIQLCARAKSNASNLSDTEHAMYRLVQESFIFHVTTSLPFQQGHLDQVEIEAALQLAEDAAHSHFQPEDFFYATSPVLGSPPQLFRCIYMTYRLYKDSLSKRVDKSICQSLDRDLERWSDHIAKLASGSSEKSDRELRDSGGRIMPASSKENKQQISSYVFLGQRLYIFGCRILLHRMSPTEGMSESAFETLMTGAIEDVRLLQPGSDYFAEYYCWPLLTIGMNLEHQADQEMLMAQVRAFWMATNNGTMRRLADILDVYWKSTQNG